MKDLVRFSLVIFLILGLTHTAFSPAQAQEDRLSRFAEAIRAFEAFAAEQMSFDRTPGFSIGFIKDDFTWARGFGFADLENRVPVGAESSYRLASLTKTITAIAVLQLVEAGKMNLDAEIQTYVPYFPRKRWPVTIRQLLGHLGGISHYRNYAQEGHIKERKDTRQSLAIFQDFDLVAEPGTRYHYSSYGYNLLGAAIEGAAGLGYGEYIKKHIFEPLGMGNSRLDNPLDLIPNRVRGYQIIKGELKNSEFVDVSSRFAAGGVRSTVVDLLKYARTIIEGRILQESTWKRMFSSMALRSGAFTWYGMGWSVQPWDGHFAASHGGSQPETRTHLLIFPADTFAVAIAANLEGSNLMPYVRRLAELVIDEDLDSRAYTADKVWQSMVTAVYLVFSHGMSHYQWNRLSLAKSQNDLRRAFEYFNEHVNEKNLRRNFEEERGKIMAGVHLASNQAFTTVGSYMAMALEEEWGEERLFSYYKKGPIAFFSDYIKLSASDSSAKRHPRFHKEFMILMAGWEKDWSRTYTEEARRLAFTPASNFEATMAGLKETFEGASLYPDFTAEVAEAAEYYLRRQKPERAIAILKSGQPLYSASPLLHASLGLAYLWQGESESAHGFYKKAHELDPRHPAVSLTQFVASANLLARAEKSGEAIGLGAIALEFYPKEIRLYLQLSDICLALGQKDKAIDYLKKALTLDPKHAEARKKLSALEKRGESE
ncbi:MAG: tetratricopeptide repeat protein [Candidatus Aminicenantes bacterium]|nr:tetratricopeptide repeat protein [Candidatus Aminicenantes bacterium]